MKKTRHHRKCKCHGGKNGKHNVVLVPADKHRYFHYLFSVNGRAMTPEEIAVELSRVWVDPEYIVTIQKRVHVAFSENPQQFGEKKGFVPP